MLLFPAFLSYLQLLKYLFNFLFINFWKAGDALMQYMMCQCSKLTPWTCRVDRKNCTPIAGVLDNGGELGMELSTAEENISTSKLALENLNYYIIPK